MLEIMESLDNAGDIETDHRLDHRGVGVRIPVESRIFTSPYHPHRFWGPPSLSFN
jgi:hypothetical protein